MEHIVQFAIGIDDEAVRKRIVENAESTIIKNIQADVEHRIFDTDWCGRTRKEVLSSFSADILKKIIENNKEKIIELAADKLADNLRRTKAVKEAVQKVVENG